MNDDFRLVQIVPSSRQLAHQQLEFYAFVHFTVNTFTDKEWGDGTEKPEIFNPVKLNPDQWCKAIKSAGMKGLILTCKHHDGFCLWPSKFTDHTIAASPYKNGKGDIVKETAEACKKAGLKFGIYLSPWDRHSEFYGKGKEYDDYYVNQLTELLTNYGPVFSVWFDGACGEGQNGKKQYYDWERYYSVIRKLQKDACISVCGPDVRWCGNEAGNTRKSEWSVVPFRTSDTEKIASKSQKADDNEFRLRKILASDEDLGSRSVLHNEQNLIWYPAEVNTSIRPGWFYHKTEDDKVRSLEELIKIYKNSVGGNASFLLNIPPTPEGLFHENDVKRLSEIGEYLNTAFGKNLLQTEKCKITSPNVKTGYKAENVIIDSYDTCFSAEGGSASCQINFEFENKQTIRNIVIKENITKSQRVEAFELYTDGQLIYRGTTIGYKKIVSFDNQEILAKKITLKITDSRLEPYISFMGIY